MVFLYSGTPGSGKSLHAAKDIYRGLRRSKALYIANFPINLDIFNESERKRFIFVPNNELLPSKLVKIAIEYWNENVAKNLKEAERSIRLFIDEAQLIFNSRSWQKKQNQDWGAFFSVHRHYGFEIVLISQQDFNLDKQVRGVIEYNYIHRKLSNVGILGKCLSFLLGGLFYCKEIWYQQNDKMDGYFFRYRSIFDNLYDTGALFGVDGKSSSIIRIKGKD